MMLPTMASDHCTGKWNQGIASILPPMNTSTNGQPILQQVETIGHVGQQEVKRAQGIAAHETARLHLEPNSAHQQDNVWHSVATLPAHPPPA